MDLLSPDEIDQAVALLRQSIPVAFPTETVYGLGSRVFDFVGIEKIFQMKGRPLDNPLICHIASFDAITLLAREIPSHAMKLATHFWPGPLTIVLKKQPNVLDCVTAGLDTVAIRMPRHPIALELIRKVGEPLAAPSANRSGKPSSTTAAHVLKDFQAEKGAVIDGGPAEEGVESTVIFLAEGPPLLLRYGSLDLPLIAAVLGCEVAIAQGVEKKASPGTRYRHYAPEAKVKLFQSFDEALFYQASSPPASRFFISCEPHPAFFHMMPSTFYALLRQADDEGCEEIIAVCKDDVVLRDRLSRIVRGYTAPTPKV